MLTRGRRLAQRMGLTRLRVKVFPPIWNIPFGITPAFVPSFQLPAKVTIQLGEPLDWSRKIFRVILHGYRESIIVGV